MLTAQPPSARDLARLSDEALLSLVASSDEDALAALYDRFGGVAYGLALRILRDEALAQDAVQDAFLGVWRTADRFLAERAKASTWILTLVHRRAVDLVRREHVRRSEPLEGAPEPAAATSVEDEASLGFRRRVVQEALSQLPPEQRQALELGYYGGLTQSELAERLDQPLGTIKSRVFTRLSPLRDLLHQAGPEGSYPQNTQSGPSRPRRATLAGAYDLVAVPSIVFCSPPPIWIRRGFDCSGFATRTSSTPSW